MDSLHWKKSSIVPVMFLGLAFGLAGCNEKGGEATGVLGEGKVVATVNGEKITETALNEYRSLRPRNVPGDDDEALLDELVTQTVATQQAIKDNLDKEPEVAQELELLRIRVLASALVRKVMKDTTVSDEELMAEYEQLKARMISTEYKASHILVKDEQLAKDLIKQLNEGADFAELAKENSTDASKQQGGDLGWFNAKQMVAPFSEAVAQLEKGSYSREPVKTQFGWHIIRLEDSRVTEAPALHTIKPRLEQMIKQNKVREYIQSLKDKAQITITSKADKPEVKKPDEAVEKKEDASEETTEEPASSK